MCYKKNVILFLISITILLSCCRVHDEKVIISSDISSQTSLPASQKETVESKKEFEDNVSDEGYTIGNAHYINVPDIYGYGLLDVDIFNLYSKDAEFSEGRAVRDTYILSAPSLKVYDVAFLFKGRTVCVHRKLRVINNQTEAIEWYMVSCEPQEGLEWSVTGFIPADDLIDADAPHEEIGEPWLMEKGREYYYSSSLKDPSGTFEYDTGPFWLVDHDEEAGIYSLKNSDDEVIYVRDSEGLTPFMGIIDGRVKHAE